MVQHQTVVWLRGHPFMTAASILKFLAPSLFWTSTCRQHGRHITHLKQLVLLWVGAM